MSAAALLALVLVVPRAAPVAAPYPADPFADEYASPEAEKEVGTAAGQLRCSSAAGAAGPIADPTLLGTIEIMPHAHLGVRASSALQLSGRSGDPAPWAFRVGPSLHLLPYRRVDLAVFFEGGPAIADLFVSAPKVSPMVVFGAELSLALSPLFFVKLQGELGWATFDDEGSARRYLRPALFLGLGVSL